MSIKTKYGTATIYNGYVKITPRKESNNNKYLPRLIYENTKQGLLWRYVIKGEIDICSTSLDKLKQRVLKMGYTWEELP